MEVAARVASEYNSHHRELHFVTWCFYLARKILVALAIFAHLRTFLGLSSPFYFLSLEFGENYYSCYFCDIYYYVFLASKKNPCYFFFATFADFSAPFLAFSLSTCVEFCYIFYSCDYCDTCYLVFLTSKKTPCYFCDFCDICWLFGALLGLSSECWILFTFVILAIFAIFVRDFLT